MTFSFKSLSLTGVKTASGTSLLTPGRYVCRVRDAELSSTKTGDGMRLLVKLREINDKGGIMDGINIHLPSSPKAEGIGREQLKALLVHGGHPDPDNIGECGVASIKGLTVGVIVGMGKGVDGLPRAEVKGYFPPDEHAESDTAGKAAPSKIGDDDIPF